MLLAGSGARAIEVGMQEGWLIRDGEVLASAVRHGGLSAHAVSRRTFSGGVGAVVINGPAVVVGAPVARVGDADRLAGVSKGHAIHIVGFGRRAFALSPSVAMTLRPQDTVEFRSTS
jgi:hypothetical protein